MKSRRIMLLVRIAVVALVALAAASAMTAAGLAAPAPALLASPAYAATIADARAAVAEVWAAHPDATSLSIALVDDGHIVYREGFGYMDRAKETPVAPETMYCIGSVSKMLATVGVMKLVERGEIDLDEPYVRYVPEFRSLTPDYRQITVRMLLDHSSGLPGADYRNLIGGFYYPGYVQQVLDSTAISRLKTTPGYMSVYCNDGFTLMERLIANVTGKTYPAFVRDEITGPLGMDHTRFALETFADGTYAKCYTWGSENPFEATSSFASGGAYSTPTDMTRFATMIMNGGTLDGARILSPASIAEMGRDQVTGSFYPVVQYGLRYGLGWDTVTEPGMRAVGVTGWAKGGATIDYHSELMVAPKAKLAVMISAVAPLTTAPAELAQRVMIHALADKRVIARVPRKLPTIVPPLANATTAQLAGIDGYFVTHGMTFHMSVSKSRTRSVSMALWTPEGEQVLHTGMRMRTDGRFWADGKPGAITAIKAAGRTYLVGEGVQGYGHYRGQSLYAQKVAAGQPMRQAWTDRLGKMWFLVNAQPTDVNYVWDMGPVGRFYELPGVTGFLQAQMPFYSLAPQDGAAGDDIAPMFIQLPGAGSRDQNDVVVLHRGDEEWLRFGSMILRPDSSIPALPMDATSTVAFGPEGYGEWRTVSATAAVDIEDATAWRMYDSGMHSVGYGSTFPVTAHAPEPGSRLLVFGAPGSGADVRVTPEVGALIKWRTSNPMPKMESVEGDRLW